MESLVTGQLMIELDFHPDEPVRLVGGDIEYPELPTIPSAFEQITKKIERLPIEEIFNKLSSTLVGIEKLVNDPEVMGTLKSLHLAVEDFRTLIKDVNAQVDPLATSVDNTLKGYHKLARDVDKQVGPLASGIKKAVKGYDKLARDVDRQVEPLSKEIIKALKAFTGAAAQAEKTLRAVRGVVSADSLVTTELTTTLKELSSAARSIRVWANYLERHPEALIRGKGGYRR
jgi:paraquat-inducible protein B